eukprot:1148607-Pelagomonas_calceolata.AAC.7
MRQPDGLQPDSVRVAATCLGDNTVSPHRKGHDANLNHKKQKAKEEVAQHLNTILHYENKGNNPKSPLEKKLPSRSRQVSATESQLPDSYTCHEAQIRTIRLKLFLILHMHGAFIPKGAVV